MFKDLVESCVNQINENFNIASDVDKYLFPLSDPAYEFAHNAWLISMLLASVVFAIVACLELYQQTVKIEGHGGQMGSAEAVFKVMFKVAVCYCVLQASFALLEGIYGTMDELTRGFSTISFGNNYFEPVLDLEAILADVPDGFGGLLPFLLCLVIVLLSWAAKIAALVLMLMRLVQVYLYLCIAPIPLATFPSHEYSQIGKSFLKSFVAVCFQGVLIYLVVRLMPALIQGAIEGGMIEQAGDLSAMLSVAVLYSFGILATLGATEAMSRKICGAA